MTAFSQHAVERYIERVKPCLDRDRAWAELKALAPLGEIVTQRPAWAGTGDAADGFLCLCDCVCFPVINGLAVTCLVRGSLPKHTRLARNKARARRTFARTHKRSGEGRPAVA